MVSWVVFNYAIALIIYLHPTRPRRPFFNDRQRWNATVAQVAYSTVVRGGPIYEALTHNISVHTPHHIDTRIPLYRLKEAYADLKATGFSAAIVENRLRWSSVHEIFETCKLLDFDTQTWYRFLRSRVDLSTLEPRRYPTVLTEDRRRCHEGGSPSVTAFVTDHPITKGGNDQCCALGRSVANSLEVHLLAEDGSTVSTMSVPPDLDGLRGLVRKVAPLPGGQQVVAVIESMNGARLVHDTHELTSWQVEIAHAAKAKGLAPLAGKTDGSTTGF